MTTATRDLLDAFIQLPEAEQLAFAAEVLRRTMDHESLPLEDEELTMAADAIFLDLDARETANGQP